MVTRIDLCGPGVPLVEVYRIPQQTPGEPVYPDLSQPPREIPQDIMTQLEEIVDFDQLEPGENMVFIIPTELLESHFDYDFAQFFNLEEEYERRQKAVLDIKQMDEQDYDKPATTGRPANNNDPYPVDAKIAQLQMHTPFTRIHKMQFCDLGPCSTHARHIIELSYRTEQRLTQLENILSTSMRYLHRTASRFSVNCVYFGGQNEYNKYNTIRCLHDDLINDGQQMSLDQCLNCTRYEPVIGKVYDILDENGHNLEVLQDDNQKAYRSMEEYFDLIRTERMHSEQSPAVIDLQTLRIKPEDFQMFKEKWPAGFEMNWSQTTIETQLPDIHFWGKDAPSTNRSVQSSQQNRLGQDTGYRPPIDMISLQETSQELIGDIADFEENELDPDGCTAFAARVNEFWQDGKQKGAAWIHDTIRRMKEDDYEKHILSISRRKNLDPSLVLALITVESLGRVGIGNSYGFTGLMQVPRDALVNAGWSEGLSTNEKARIEIEVGTNYMLQKKSFFGSNGNTMLMIVAYNAGEGMIAGVRSNSSVNHIADMSAALDRSTMSSWTWRQIAPCVIQNAVTFYGDWKEVEVGTFYPRVVHAYEAILNYEGTGLFDTPSSELLPGGLLFPLRSEDIEQYNIRLTSPYGTRTINGEVGHHQGHDYGGPEGVPIIAIADGDVIGSIYSDSGGNMVTIRHHNGLVSRYLHMKNRGVPEGPIKQGQQVGVIGNTGRSGGNHLHFDIAAEGKRVDPVQYYPALRPIVDRYLATGRTYQPLAGHRLDAGPELSRHTDQHGLIQ